LIRHGDPLTADMTFTPQEALACRRLIELALDEDLGDDGDVTSQAMIPLSQRGGGRLVAHRDGVLAGMPAVELVLKAVDGSITCVSECLDGTRLSGSGTILARVQGPMLGILASERIALNFLQRLSGTATLTRRYVDAVAGLPCKILDTRKTAPGWRLLEKYAVRQGGGHNHRLGLYDGILIKDNHLAALGGGLSAIRRTIETARQKYPNLPVEIEVDDLDQLTTALRFQADIILLDNMRPAQLREAVKLRNELAAGVTLEASGGITLESVRDVAETGVDRISIGALTHSTAALDIALDYDA